MEHNRWSLELCMDIFDFFNAEEYEFFTQIALSKSDGTARLLNALDWIRERAAQLVLEHRDTEDAYPERLLLNRPA